MPYSYHHHHSYHHISGFALFILAIVFLVVVIGLISLAMSFINRKKPNETQFHNEVPRRSTDDYVPQTPQPAQQSYNPGFTGNTPPPVTGMYPNNPPNPGYVGNQQPGYNPNYQQQQPGYPPQHTGMSAGEGAILGAAGGFAAAEILDSNRNRGDGGGNETIVNNYGNSNVVTPDVSNSSNVPDDGGLTWGSDSDSDTSEPDDGGVSSSDDDF